MIVEFKSSYRNEKESWERSKQKELTGDLHEEFYNEEDYIGLIAIEMDNIIEFEQAFVYHNEERLNCVLAYNKEGISTRNLLINYEDFKSIFEKNKGIRVVPSDELIE